MLQLWIRLLTRARHTAAAAYIQVFRQADCNRDSVSTALGAPSNTVLTSTPPKTGGYSLIDVRPLLGTVGTFLWHLQHVMHSSSTGTWRHGAAT